MIDMTKVGYPAPEAYRAPDERALATIKVYISADAFHRDTTEELTDPMLAWVTALVQEQIDALPGYSGYECGWVKLSSPQTYCK
jgi:hypothetical protein